MTWEMIALYGEVVFGTYYDKTEGFFICPECGEPLYECDWNLKDFINQDGEVICPICESVLFDKAELIKYFDKVKVKSLENKRKEQKYGSKD